MDDGEEEIEVEEATEITQAPRLQIKLTNPRAYEDSESIGCFKQHNTQSIAGYSTTTTNEESIEAPDQPIFKVIKGSRGQRTISMLVSTANQDDLDDLSISLPLIRQSDSEGYDLNAMVQKAAEVLALDLSLGIQVEYYSQTWSAFISIDDVRSCSDSKTP